MPGADGHLWNYMESHGRQREVNGLRGDTRDAVGLWQLCHNCEGQPVDESKGGCVRAWPGGGLRPKVLTKGWVIAPRIGPAVLW